MVWLISPMVLYCAMYSRCRCLSMLLYDTVVPSPGRE